MRAFPWSVLATFADLCVCLVLLTGCDPESLSKPKQVATPAPIATPDAPAQVATSAPEEASPEATAPEAGPVPTPRAAPKAAAAKVAAPHAARHAHHRVISRHARRQATRHASYECGWWTCWPTAPPEPRPISICSASTSSPLMLPRRGDPCALSHSGDLTHEPLPPRHRCGIDPVGRRVRSAGLVPPTAAMAINVGSRLDSRAGHPPPGAVHTD